MRQSTPIAAPDLDVESCCTSPCPERRGPLTLLEALDTNAFYVPSVRQKQNSEFGDLETFVLEVLGF